MTSLKTVLLGSAAGLIAVGAAQAADLPVKKAAAAVQYVEVCPVYGSGFYKLPGSDICIRHFGSVKFTGGFQDERTAWFGPGDTEVQAGGANTVGWQYTIRPGWDFRSPTEYGTLRTVVQLRVDQRNGIFADDAPVLTLGMRTNNLIHRGYIEWAGFIVGRTSTQFTYWDQDDVQTAIGGDPKETLMQLTYVFSAPGGFKATIGLEDASQWGGNGVEDLTTLVPGGASYGGPQRLYDVVATASTEQSWGNAKVGALLHFIHTNADLDGNGAADTNEIGTGYALLGGITFNLPMLGPKDQLLLQANWCDGVIQACGIQGGAANDSSAFERRGQFLNGMQRTSDVDAYLVNNGASTTDWEFENTKGWSVAGQLRHYWSPMWRSNFMASYVSIDVPNAGFLATGVGDATVWDVGFNLIWGQSRKTAEIGIEVAYKSLEQDVSPAIAASAAANGIDTNPSGWSAIGFIQRNW